jgi:hypothetical protein
MDSSVSRCPRQSIYFPLTTKSQRDVLSMRRPRLGPRPWPNTWRFTGLRWTHQHLLKTNLSYCTWSWSICECSSDSISPYVPHRWQPRRRWDVQTLTLILTSIPRTQALSFIDEFISGPCQPGTDMISMGNQDYRCATTFNLLLSS